MSVTEDIKAAKSRFAVYVVQLQDLLKQHDVRGKNWLRSLKAANADPEFVRRRSAIWKEILEHEGGKLTFGTVLAIVGTVVGGVGIAFGGTAFGMPLVLLLAPAGIWIGNEIDEEGLTKRFFRILLHQPDEAPVPEVYSRSDTEANRLQTWQERMRAPVEKTRHIEVTRHAPHDSPGGNELNPFDIFKPNDPELVEKTLARLNEQNKWNDVFSTKLIDLLDNIDKIKSEARESLREVTERLQKTELVTQAESLLLDKAKEFGEASQRLEFAHAAQKRAHALAEEAQKLLESANAALADSQRNEEIARSHAESANAQLLLAREAEERAARLSKGTIRYATTAVAISWIATGWIGWLSVRTEPALWAVISWTIIVLGVATLILRGAKRDA